MQCENCKQEHDESYGSGRFCSSKCARGFATKAKRPEISRRVSMTLQKEKHCTLCGKVWWKEPGEGYSANFRCQHCREVAGKNKSWDDVSLPTKKARLIRERSHKCEDCGITTWKDKPVVLELHHVNANREDNSKQNLQLLCPNCHSTTPNFGWKKAHSKLAR